jgi:hypothetical protein
LATFAISHRIILSWNKFVFANASMTWLEFYCSRQIARNVHIVNANRPYWWCMMYSNHLNWYQNNVQHQIIISYSRHESSINLLTPSKIKHILKHPVYCLEVGYIPFKVLSIFHINHIYISVIILQLVWGTALLLITNYRQPSAIEYANASSFDC